MVVCKLCTGLESSLLQDNGTKKLFCRFPSKVKQVESGVLSSLKSTLDSLLVRTCMPKIKRAEGSIPTRNKFTLFCKILKFKFFKDQN